MRPNRSLPPAVGAALLSGLFIALLSFQAATDAPRPLHSFFLELPEPAVSLRADLPPRKAPPGPALQVVLISVDGLRPDAIVAARAPQMLRLVGRGAVAAHAETIRPSYTLPSHTSMLTGLDYRRHRVAWNSYRPGHLPHATVFTVAAEAGLSTAMLFAKEKFHYLAAPGRVHWIYGPAVPQFLPWMEDVTRPDFSEGDGPAAPAARGATSPGSVAPSRTDREAAQRTSSADGLARAFAKEWPKARYQLTFIHFAEPDRVGHSRGWMTRPYLDAVLKVDTAIGEILKTIDDAGGTGSTAVLVTADHGGSGYLHYSWSAPDLPANVRIPWICAGPGVQPGTVIRRPIRTMDTAPTVLSLLGLPVPADLDGTVVREVVAER